MTLRPTNPFVAACRASPVARGRLLRAAVGAAVACLALLWSLALHGDVGRAGPEPIAAISAPQDLDAAKVSLGAKLFGDPRLSESGKLACTSCQDLAGGGDDGLPRSRGSDARWLDFNAPTVFNAALNFRLNWRGNFRGFEAQNEAVLLDPRIMGSRWPVLLRRLEAVPEYATGFEAAYGRSVRREDVLDALASFQRSLVTPDARFDRYLKGDGDVLRADELQGYELFDSYGCISCHHGQNVGGNLFQRFGIFEYAAVPLDDDADRFSVTGLEADRRVYRVPSLRNVAATAPYLHDGRAATLESAIEIMGRSQLGIELPPQHVDLIAQFLRTLTGEYQGRPVASGS
jgi:cytochrome c peroxidase